MTLLRFVPVALLGAVCCAQTAPFQIQIPNVADTPVDRDAVEITGNLPNVILLRVLNPVAADVDYGRISTKLNGQSANFIQTISCAADGKIVRMDLKLREGMRLEPGVNTVEITAINRRGRKFYRNFVIRAREEKRNEYFIYESTIPPAAIEGGR